MEHRQSMRCDRYWLVCLPWMLSCCVQSTSPDATDTESSCSDAAKILFFPDNDQDGYGDETQAVEACVAPENHIKTGGDCDDSRGDIHPDAEEVCDDIDYNCDDIIPVTQTWYLDADGDGYGDPNEAIEACEPPPKYVSVGGDCNDTTADVGPDVVDICNGFDDDCDDIIDEDAKAGWNLVSVDHEYVTVWEVDRYDGTLSEIAPLIITDEEIPTMDVRPDGLGVVYDSNNKQLMEIDVCHGTLTPIGPTGADRTCGIAFGPDGTLYGMDKVNDNLIQFDLATGEATVVGPLGFDLTACGLAYNCQTRELLGADSASDQLFKLNMETGQAYDFIQTSVPFGAVGLEFEAATGMLLAATGSSYYLLDPESAESTHLGDFEASHINDLAYYPQCP